VWGKKIEKERFSWSFGRDFIIGKALKLDQLRERLKISEIGLIIEIIVDNPEYLVILA
jgi:hypothetical protein